MGIEALQLLVEFVFPLKILEPSSYARGPPARRDGGWVNPWYCFPGTRTTYRLDRIPSMGCRAIGCGRNYQVAWEGQGRPLIAAGIDICPIHLTPTTPRPIAPKQRRFFPYGPRRPSVHHPVAMRAIPKPPPQSALAALDFVRLLVASGGYTTTTRLRYATRRQGPLGHRPPLRAISACERLSDGGPGPSQPPA